MTNIANLTVAIATLNRPSVLERCLEALLFPENLPKEVVIVDQSSDNATQALLENRWMGSALLRGVQLLYVRQRRRGLSASRNAAFAHAGCPVVAVTDDDCVPDHGWVTAIEQTFASAIAPDAVTGRMLPIGPETAGRHASSSRSGTAGRLFTSRAVPMFIGTGGNFAAKREWVDRVNGFDERLGAGSPGKAAEDIDIFYRLLRAGARIWYEPRSLVYHERQPVERYQASRWSYGYGIGAFCGSFLRRGDVYSLRILVFWLRYQGQNLLNAIRRRDAVQVENGKQILAGTASGFKYGLSLWQPQSLLEQARET